MPVWSWFFIAAAVVLVITLVMVLVLSLTGRTRTERLKKRFGREYERVVGEAGDQRAGEEELVARERKRQKLQTEKDSAT
jgi:NADH:ubiquinone oxidoreductase subunit 3 (subunit A)